MTLRAAYFANQFAAAEGHGMRRYAFELFEALAARGDIDLTPAAGWSNLAPDALADLQARTGLRVLPSGRRGTSYGWTFLGLPRIEWMLPGPVDVVHAVCMGYPVATGRPLVVTVHDLGPLTHPEYFSHNIPLVMRRALTQAVRQAHTIVAISQATADEILQLHPEAQAKVKVVHSGVAERFFAPPPDDALDGVTLPPDGVPFILAAGKISPRKNIQGLLRALALIGDEIPHHLALTGGDGWDVEQIGAELDASGLGHRVHMLGFVSDDALRALYRRAAIYVHPSLYEGFGLTVLEAMANGVPVITSTTSSLPEVAGDAARLVHPSEPGDIAAAILDIVGSDTLAAELRAKGLARARSFPWSRTAEAMAEIYRQAAGTKG